MQITKKTIYSPDITCGSCVKVLSKMFENTKGIEKFSISVTSSAIDLEYDASALSEEQLLRLIHNKGYRASFSVFGRKTFSDRYKDFVQNKEKYAMEYTMLRYSGLSLLLLLLLQAIVWKTIFGGDVTLLTTKALWILYLDITVVALGAALWHFHAYKTEVPCMVGMMIGMTLGMQSSMLLGTIIGATNGIFIGSVVGVLVGVVLGAFNGKCCGIMGIMEGMMAGVMGGTMGPMIAVMMQFDRLLWFMPLFMLVNLFILWGLSYMLYEEVVEENPTVEKQPLDFMTFFSFCLVSVILFVFIIFFI
ncbi:heavy-metal-associated domain-containing protein [Candidatus Woesearchaeota archaeon]|nr:heavy-metal-associated domain-containing protein [Candidatus Woesearchaeota archaeon]